MITYFDNEKDAAGFANDINETFGPGSASITTIIQEKSVAYVVTSATGSYSADTDLEQVAKDFFKTQANT